MAPLKLADRIQVESRGGHIYTGHIERITATTDQRGAAMMRLDIGLQMPASDHPGPRTPAPGRVEATRGS